MKQAPKPGKNKKILIVEDEGDMCLLLNILLEGDGMRLDHVRNLTAAKEYLEQDEPAAIILDNKLPDGFGVDFVSFIKNKYPAVPVILITGFDGAVEDLAIENGADSFLKKPFTRKALELSLQRVLN